jgi:hypothetical protein
MLTLIQTTNVNFDIESLHIDWNKNPIYLL